MLNWSGRSVCVHWRKPIRKRNSNNNSKEDNDHNSASKVVSKANKAVSNREADNNAAREEDSRDKEEDNNNVHRGTRAARAETSCQPPARAEPGRTIRVAAGQQT